MEFTNNLLVYVDSLMNKIQKTMHERHVDSYRIPRIYTH